MTQLTLHRIFNDPDLNGSSPVALKFSPDGSRVTYLKPSQKNFERLDLWEFNVATQQTRLLVDARKL